MTDSNQTTRPIACACAASRPGVTARVNQKSLLRGVTNGIVLSTMAWAAVGYLTFALR